MRIDWDKCRVDYVAGRETYQELADKYGISKVSVAKKAKAEKWVAQRAAYRRSVANKAIGRKKERDAEKLEKLMEAADNLVDSVLRITRDKQQFFRGVMLAPTRNEDGELEAVALEYVTRKADMRNLSHATKALNELTRAVRNLHDIPTGEEERDRKLAERKMRLAERREGAAVEGNGGVIEISAVMEEQPEGLEVDT